MNRFIAAMLGFFSCIFLFISQAEACTDFKVQAKDGTVLIARSMEFSVQMNANLRSSNRGRLFHSTAPDGKPALSWKAKFGYLFIDAFNQDYAIDGINENGLSFENLYLPGETQYQNVPPGKEAEALPYLMLGDWVLSNFKTVDEVRTALATLYIFEQSMPALNNMVFPLHAAVFDVSGKGIVIEFAGGQIHIYDNIGVMTNSPTYDWHLTNLRNYLNLSPYTPKPITANGITYSAIGQGAGMVGLPGDISPPSRFVKTAFLVNAAYPVNTAADVLNLAQHVINNVDIPYGLARAISQGKETAELTQWVVFKDLTHKILFYRTYNDMTVRQISLDKVNFTEGAARLKMPLADKPYIMDMSDKFTHSPG